jgi:excisionase family DNA binding protein
MNNATTEVLTVQEAAAYLKVSRDKVYDMCADNILPHRHLGRLIRNRRSDLDSFMSELDKPDAVCLG